MTRRLLLLSILLVPATSPLLHAQDGSTVRTLKTRSISFQVDKALPPIFAHSLTATDDTPGSPVKVKSYLNHEVEPLQMSGTKLIFTTSPDRSSIDESKDLIAKVTVSENIRSAVLMFLPGDGKADSPKYRVLPVEDTTRAFPQGSFKIVNLSPVPVRIVLEGKKKYDFKPGDIRVIEDPPVNARNASGMRAFNFVDDQWDGIGSTSWPHPGKKRVIHVAFYNPASKKVEFRGIRDIASPEPVE